MGPNEAALRKACKAEPAPIRKQGEAWEQGATDLRLVSERLRAKQSELKAAWPSGDDGEAATTAFEKLATYVDSQAERMDQGARSYRTAARAITLAKADYGSLPTPPGGSATLGDGATPQQTKQADEAKAAGEAEREQKAGEYLQVMEGRFDKAQGQMKEAAPYDAGVTDGGVDGRDQGYGGSDAGSYSSPGTGGTGPYSTSRLGTFAGTAVVATRLKGRPVLGGTIRPGTTTGIGTDDATADGVVGGTIPGATGSEGASGTSGSVIGGSAGLGGGSGGALGATGAAALAGGGKGLLGRLGGASASAGAGRGAGGAGASGRAAGSSASARGGAIGGRSAAPSKGVLGGRSSGAAGAAGQSAARGGAAGQGAGSRGATAPGQQAGGRSAGAQSGRASGASGRSAGAAGRTAGGGMQAGGRSAPGASGSSAKATPGSSAAGTRGGATGAQGGGGAARGTGSGAGGQAGRGTGPGAGGQAGRGTQHGRDETPDTRRAMVMAEDWLDDDDVAPDVIQ